MTFDDVKKYFGTVQEACRKLEYTAAAIYAWQQTGIPLRSQRNIEALTKGALKASKK